jgi:predicted nucleic acid-binding protein
VRLLVDTCVLSELHRPKADPRVRARLESIPESDLYLSVVTLGELTNGIMRLAAGKRRRELDAWLSQIEQLYSPRIFAIDIETARIWGEITARASKQGNTIPIADGLIAATALRHGLHLMTRNLPHFRTTGILLLDPWQDA